MSISHWDEQSHSTGTMYNQWYIKGTINERWEEQKKILYLLKQTQKMPDIKYMRKNARQWTVLLKQQYNTKHYQGNSVIYFKCIAPKMLELRNVTWT